MREVIGVSSRRIDGPRRCTTQPPQSAGLSDFKPGYLDLSPEALARLVSTDPIEDHYHVEQEPFARGKYATVRRCRHRVTGLEFAAKYLKRRRRSTDIRYEILHEVAVLEMCAPCGQIVNLYQVFETASEMILLLELAPGGELQALIDRDELIDENMARRFIRQILNGLQYLHAFNVVHLDIKPQNLVLTGEFPNSDVKLCDFGISRYVGEDDDIREILGTPDYIAPEVLNYETISLATDMWSIGVLIYVLLTGFSPFGGDTKQETFCNISRGELDFPDDLFDGISDSAKDLIRRLVVKDPRARLTASECLEHEWLRSGLKTVASPQPEPKMSLENIRIAEEQAKKSEVLRAFRSSVGHERNINRAAALVRNPSLRGSVDYKREAKKALASETVPVRLFACRLTTEPSSVESDKPRFPCPVFIDTPVAAVQTVARSEDLPSVTISETSSITSDNVSEMSIDSSGDCSSLTSSEDTSDWEPPWVRQCSGIVQRARSRFNVSPTTTTTTTNLLATRRTFCLSTPNLFVPDNRKYGLQLLKEHNGNEVVIREVKSGRVSRIHEVKCESVQSRIMKFQARCHQKD